MKKYFCCIKYIFALYWCLGIWKMDKKLITWHFDDRFSCLNFRGSNDPISAKTDHQDTCRTIRSFNKKRPRRPASQPANFCAGYIFTYIIFFCSMEQWVVKRDPWGNLKVSILSVKSSLKTISWKSMLNINH